MINFNKIFSILLLFCVSLLAEDSSLIRYVNPFIGTSNGGNTFPGAVVPWGMVSVSPHNSPGSPSGYIYGEKYFYGFGHTHLSGTGCSDLGNIIITAAAGELKTDPEDYKSSYHSEEASPGYYKIFLDEPELVAEVTASTRAGMTKLIPEKNKEINILFDVGRSLSINGGGMINILSANEVEGYNIGGGFCGENNRHKVFFYAQFNQNFSESGIWLKDKIFNKKYGEISDSSVGGWFKFNLQKDKPLIIKVGISYVSTKNARENLTKEIPDFDFNSVKKKAEELWGKNLNRIFIEGDNINDKIKFYTAYYHMLIHPNIVSDINGEYPLMGRSGIGKYKNKNRYSVFSLWDTYRTLHPFLTLVFPEIQSEIIKTIIDMYEESGYLPKWELAGNETYMMVGDPAPIVIADSYIKGIKDFDTEKAFDAFLKPALLNGGEAPPIRAGYHEMLEFGYIPFEQDWAKEWWVWGPVSTTLEYCLSDFAISQFAKKSGRNNEAEIFKKRSLLYKNLFDKETNFIRPRLKNGTWLEPWDTLAVEGSGDWEGSGGPGYVEGNTWNYTFFVPHDVEGLINLFGGEKNFSKKLEESFWNNQFTINNEPDFSYPYLFTYVKGEEEKTDYYIQKIMNENFGIDHKGLPGNDDCGTTSGWFVFSALGFYPVTPASEYYCLTEPLFDKIILKINKEYFEGSEFIIKKVKNSGYNSVEINGKKIENFQINHNEIVKGGILTINK